jgi:UDP-N-acetylglucosamine 2-epimerase (non-hydrolysing)
MKKRILIVFGTRPEAIKFAPLIKALKLNNLYDVKICITSQHKEMLQQVLSFFQITADVDLDVMQTNQDLTSLTSSILIKLRDVIKSIQPNLVMVQGDTTTAFAAALAAYYHKIPVAHLEAGLRSHQIYSPFPEEINRKLVGTISTLHFAPTLHAKENLFQEHITENVFITGNTVVDALLMGLDILKTQKSDFSSLFPFYDKNKKMILVTGHRRESFGDGFQQICHAIKTIAIAFPDIQIIYPVHLNPNVQEPVRRLLSDVSIVHLISPLSYEQMIWLLQHCYLVLTDSGGVQEEAPSLGKPVLVMRDVTERMEGIEAGTAKLVGTNADNIIEQVKELLLNHETYHLMSKSVNPYGDGTASQQIIEQLNQYFA